MTAGILSEPKHRLKSAGSNFALSSAVSMESPSPYHCALVVYRARNGGFIGLRGGGIGRLDKYIAAKSADVKVAKTDGWSRERQRLETPLRV